MGVINRIAQSIQGFLQGGKRVSQHLGYGRELGYINSFNTADAIKDLRGPQYIGRGIPNIIVQPSPELIYFGLGNILFGGGLAIGILQFQLTYFFFFLFYIINTMVF